MNNVSQLLAFVVEHISIPKSLYEKAADRHRSLGDWLSREGSTLAAFGPDIRPQGSFRFGTVNRPLHDSDEYDLDNVCLLRKLRKTELTQEELKRRYGDEVKAYALAHRMKEPVREKNRCWRLVYADEVNFHLDTLPCVPEELAVIARIAAAAVAQDLARRSVAITDRRHEHFRILSPQWPSSNPRGFAAWFEQRAALGRRSLAEGRLRATVEDVPPYEWKTPLQQSIQLFKRHRDVMFRKEPELAPISMIITNLAAHAYQGESDLADALENIVERMPNFIRPERPRIPNPADPAEDYADKWVSDARLEDNFWRWYWSAKRDVAGLAAAIANRTVEARVRDWFDVVLTEAELRQLGVAFAPVAATAASPLYISSGPRPWGR